MLGCADIFFKSAKTVTPWSYMKLLLEKYFKLRKSFYWLKISAYKGTDTTLFEYYVIITVTLYNFLCRILIQKVSFTACSSETQFEVEKGVYSWFYVIT